MLNEIKLFSLINIGLFSQHFYWNISFYNIKGLLTSWPMLVEISVEFIPNGSAS